MSNIKPYYLVVRFDETRADSSYSIVGIHEQKIKAIVDGDDVIYKEQPPCTASIEAVSALFPDAAVAAQLSAALENVSALKNELSARDAKVGEASAELAIATDELAEARLVVSRLESQLAAQHQTETHLRRQIAELKGGADGREL